jgi:hypothetical protein
VTLRVQLGCERRFNIEFCGVDSHFCHSAYVTWHHVPARLSHFCCRTHFLRRDVRGESRHCNQLFPEIKDMLIEKVRRRTFLYDKKSPDYRDQHMTANAWEEMGKELSSRDVRIVCPRLNSTAGLSDCHSGMQLHDLRWHVTPAMLFLVTINTSRPYSSRSAYCNHCLISCYRTGILDRKTLVQVLTGLLELLTGLMELLPQVTDRTIETFAIRSWQDYWHYCLKLLTGLLTLLPLVADRTAGTTATSCWDY